MIKIENLAPSVDEENSWQIASRSDLKRRSLGLFKDGHPNKKKQQEE